MEFKVLEELQVSFCTHFFFKLCKEVLNDHTFDVVGGIT